jgi:tyrosine decarboxylase/aspartate 1-decarboxylase
MQFLMKKKNKEIKILTELKNYKDKDFTFSSGKILGSMCTQPHPITKNAYVEFLESNLGDPDLFPGTKEIESNLINFVSDMLKAPKNGTGIITSGGTESNITAIWMAKKLSNKNEILLPGYAHFSFEKISSLMDIKLNLVPSSQKFVMDLSSIRKKISKNTAAIIGIAGSTELGTVDPIPELSEICNDENIFLHIDAAFGGFVIPFLKEMGNSLPDFDFSLKGISSISIDYHKMGYSAIPLGILMIRDKKWLDKISINTPYISSKKQSGLLATRSGGPVAAAYAVSKYLGLKGYRELIKNCMDNTNHMVNEINEMGLNLVVKPTLNVIGIKLKDPARVVKKLADYGWKVNKMDRLSAIRIVLMPHVTRYVIDEFTPVLRRVCRESGEIS